MLKLVLVLQLEAFSAAQRPIKSFYPKFEFLQFLTFVKGYSDHSNLILQLNTDTMKELNSKHKKFARLSGISILLMAVLAGLAIGTFFEAALKMQPEDLNDHARQFASQAQFAACCWLGIWITDILATWGFYRLYRDQQALWAGVTAGLRLIYSLMLGIAVLKLSPFFQLAETEPANLYSSLHAFEKWWSMGLIVFGFHLIGLGILNSQLGLKKIWIPACLTLGGLGYILIHGGLLALPNFGSYQSDLENVFMIPMILGEVGLALLLTIKPSYLSRSFAQAASNPTQGLGSHTQVTGDLMQGNALK